MTLPYQPVPAGTSGSVPPGTQIVPAGGESRSDFAQGSPASASEVPTVSSALVTVAVPRLFRARKLPIRKSA